MDKNFLVSSSSRPNPLGEEKSSSCFSGTPRENEHLQKIWYVRVLLFGTLLAAAAIVSTFSNIIISKNENDRFVTQYNSISSSALQSVADSFSSSSIGLRELASTFRYIYPNASVYPEVAWQGFQNTAGLLSNISAVNNIGFVPIVKPSELVSYEAFLKQYIETDPSIVKPAQMPGLEVGQVWYLKDNIPVRNDSGVQPYSPYAFFAPVSQLTYSNMFGPSFYGFDLRSFSFFRGVLDEIVTCAESDSVQDKCNTCGGMSESVPIPLPTPDNLYPVIEDVQAMMAHPIFPASNASRIVGYTMGAVSWKSILLQAVPTFVSGLDVVVTTSSGNAFTYTIEEGRPQFRGMGDKHDSHFDEYKRSKVLDVNKAHVTNAATYEIILYPRRKFVQSYTTYVSVIAPVVLVLVFMFCSIVFFAYDFLMKREFGRKQAVLDTKRRFVRFISHEIRTPLNTVKLGLKLLDGELAGVAALVKATPVEELPALFVSTAEAWRHLADDISTNSASAVEVLDDLLNYDKIEMGNLRLELTMFNVWDLARRTTSIMQMQAQQKDIVLELTCDGVLLTDANSIVPSTRIIGDVSRMGQVLKNLISNALKFTPTGGFVSVTAVTVEKGMPEANIPALKTAYSAVDPENEERAGSVQISVKDSGAGLTEQQLLEICAEGVQFNANELQAGQGSGLGLFISKGIVEQHGGTLSVASAGLGKGVTFTVELPLFEASDSPLTSPGRLSEFPAAKSLAHSIMIEAGVVSTSTRMTSDSRCVLVVDDSHFNRKMLARLLTSRGFICEQAENGEEAVRVYQDMCSRGESVDAILMDFEMPVMNGPTATKKLRELGCGCLIAGVTGNLLPEDVNNFIAHGADAVLAKPLVVEDFEALLSKHLFKHCRTGSDERSASASTLVRLKAERAQNKLLVQPTQVHPTEA